MVYNTLLMQQVTEINQISWINSSLGLFQKKKKKNHGERWQHLDRDKQIWYLSPMRAAKVQASLRIVQSRQNLRCLLIQAVNQEEP